MIRRICNSTAYQLSSRQPPATSQHRMLFAHRVLKPLTIEQTIDSVVAATGLEIDAGDRQRLIRRAVSESLDEDFSQTWQYRETVQGLMARLNMNLPAADDPLDQLYRRILSRDPTPQERELCRGHETQDIVFALINSNEFFFNH